MNLEGAVDARTSGNHRLAIKLLKRAYQECCISSDVAGLRSIVAELEIIAAQTTGTTQKRANRLTKWSVDTIASVLGYSYVSPTPEGQLVQKLEDWWDITKGGAPLSSPAIFGGISGDKFFGGIVMDT